MSLVAIAPAWSAPPKAAVAPHASSAAAASGPSKHLQLEVKRYNGLISQVKILNQQSNAASNTALRVDGEWEEKHGEVSDTHPYPPDVQSFNMIAHRLNLQLERTMRNAAKMHRRLAKEPAFRMFYTDGARAIPKQDTPGYLLNSDASNLHSAMRRDK